MSAIFSHPDFEKDGERMYGKLFYVFEETVANNDALEVAHLGDDVENATRAALEGAVENNGRVVEDGEPEKTELLKLARQKYGTQGKDIEDIVDVDLGSDLRARAQAVKDAAQHALGR